MPENKGTGEMHAGNSRNVFLAFAMGAVGVVFARCAWFGPDAYALFDSVNRIASGRGINPEDPGYLQALAHPLWLFALYAQSKLADDTYLAPMLLCWVLSMVAVFVLLAKIARTAALAWVATAAMLCSHAFVDYATSGLETPLLYFLLSLFLVAYLAEENNAFTAFAAALLISLLMLTRMDMGVLLFPALLYLLLSKRSAANTLATILGLLPLLAYLYYAVAHLELGIGALLFPAYDNPLTNVGGVRQGAAYFANSIFHDPLTLLFVLGGLALSMFMRNAKELLLAAGVFGYLVFILFSGADAYSGRLFAVPFFAGLALLTRLNIKDAAWKWTPLLAAIITAALLLPDPNLLSGEKYGMEKKSNTDQFGIKNERRIWYKKTGLLHYNRRVPTPRLADFKQLPATPKLNKRSAPTPKNVTPQKKVAPQKPKPKANIRPQDGGQKKSLKPKTVRPKRLTEKKGGIPDARLALP